MSDTKLQPDDASSCPSAQPPKLDLVYVHGANPKGDLEIVRLREDGVTIGALTPVKEGEPIRGELLRLKSRRESRRLFEAESIPLDIPEGKRLSSHGPAQISTPEYQRNWDSIFGKKCLPN